MVQRTPRTTCAYNMFLYGPVLKLYKDDHLQPFKEAIREGHYVIRVEPLYDLPINMTWLQLLKFDPIAELNAIFVFNGSSLTNETLKDIYCLKLWSRLGREPVGIQQQRDNNGNIIPFGAILDFEIVPIDLQTIDSLRRYCQCRKMKVIYCLYITI